jgi:ABC-type Fe3+-hydroxamate transport system substrate-binding protein
MYSSGSFLDQLGSAVVLSKRPERIISLVPSQTELLYDLSLDKEVAGITKFCVHPSHWRKEKKIVGGTKNFDFEEIDLLKPDLIIGNKEENYKEGIEKLKGKYSVWMSDIVSLQDALEMIQSIGHVVDREKRATQIVDRINTSFERLKKQPPRRVLYLIWRNPWMAAASGTFIHTMLSRLGLINCVEHRHRYPELSDDEIKQLDPEVIFLSSEPYPFREKHQDELRAIVSPGSKSILVDGEMFSWYGSRLLKAPEYFNSLIV